MAKINFLKYEANRGQLLGINGVKEGFDFINDFSNYFINPNDKMELKMELKIYEEKHGEAGGYTSKEFIELANEILGDGIKREWWNVENPADKLFYHEWEIANNEYEKCVNFVDSINPYPKYYFAPIQIIISCWFTWKKYPYERDLFIPGFLYKNNIMLWLSNKNYIITDFIFPFENIGTEFVEFYREIKERIPFELPIKKFRHYYPTKKETGYKIVKLSTGEIQKFEKLIE